MNMTLYEISNQYLQALQTLDDPNLPEEAVADTLEALKGDLQEKAINVAKYLRNLETMAEAIREAEVAMAKRRKVLEKRSQWFRNYIKTHMETANIHSIDSPWFKLSVQRNPKRIELDPATPLPTEFVNVEVTMTQDDYAIVQELIGSHEATNRPDKARILDRLKKGEAIDGATLVQATRLVVR